MGVAMMLMHGSSNGLDVTGWVNSGGAFWATDRAEIAEAYADGGRVIEIEVPDDANVVTVTEADELLGGVGLAEDAAGNPSVLVPWVAELRDAGVDVVHVTVDYEDTPDDNDESLTHESWLVITHQIGLDS